jgi:hypothetical protein
MEQAAGPGIGIAVVVFGCRTSHTGDVGLHCTKYAFITSCAN